VTTRPRRYLGGLPHSSNNAKLLEIRYLLVVTANHIGVCEHTIGFGLDFLSRENGNIAVADQTIGVVPNTVITLLVTAFVPNPRFHERIDLNDGIQTTVVQTVQDESGVLLVVLSVMLQPGVCGGGGEETGIVERFAAGVVWAK
jgi:hypothetical protein